VSDTARPATDVQEDEGLPSDFPNSRFWARLQNCEKQLSSSSYLPVRPSVRKEQLGSHRTDFHYILYTNISRKSVAKIQLSLKSDKNSGHFT